MRIILEKKRQNNINRRNVMGLLFQFRRVSFVALNAFMFCKITK